MQAGLCAASAACSHTNCGSARRSSNDDAPNAGMSVRVITCVMSAVWNYADARREGFVNCDCLCEHVCLTVIAAAR